MSKPDAALSVAVQRHLDGTSVEYFEMAPDTSELTRLIKELFEEHWHEITFGPCIEGAVFEASFAERPRLTFLDGYLTVSAGNRGGWHFHLCLGPTEGTPNRPTPPELSRWRRCSRAAFFRQSDRLGRHCCWGLRLWNGRDEQMMTVFFPNPWLEPHTLEILRRPDWTRLKLWMALRERFTGFPAEGEPSETESPLLH